MSLENSSGDLRQGQNYSPRSNRSVRFTEQTMDIASANLLLGNLLTEIIPIDKQSAKVRVYAPTAADYDNYSEVLSGTTNLQLPDVLTGITVTFNKNELNGAQAHSAGNLDSRGPGSFTFAPRATAQGSASIMPDAQIDIQQTWAQNVPIKHYGFYMPVNSSDAAILTKLTTLAGATVSAWPTFRPVAHTLTLKGQQISLSQSVEANETISASAEDVWSWQYADGNGYSKEGGVTVRSIRIPPTIHGVITPSGPDGTSSSAAVTTTISVSIATVATTVPSPPITLTGSTYAPAPLTETALASVTPITFAATTPSAIPTSGLYLLELNPGEQEYGYQFLVATVFNFASLV
jgi:hypothetical protein